MVALNIIVIIYLNSNWICGEEVKGSNEEVKGSKEEIKGSKEDITASEEERLIMELIPHFYSNYRDVLENTNETKSLRRIFKNDREYEIHVEKLKEVNGFKKHNLIIRESTRDNPIIYINNPVETKIPNAYLTLEGFKNMLTERISKQREKFERDYLKPKIYKNEPVPEIEINMGMTKTKRKKKLTTIPSTDKSQTESSKNKSILTLISTIRDNATQYITHSVRLKSTILPNGTTDGNNITIKTQFFETKSQSNNAYATTFATSTTQAIYTQKLNEGKEYRTKKDKIFQNSPENDTESHTEALTKHNKVETTRFEEKQQNVSTLYETKPLKLKIIKKILENVTENSANVTTPEVILTHSYLEEKKQIRTELVERNSPEDEIVGCTPENATENSLKITTEYKDILTTDSEANEQNISKLDENKPLGDDIEENTPAGTTEDIPEVITDQIEENTTDLEEVTEEITSTAVQTKRPRLSKPLVWMGER